MRSFPAIAVSLISLSTSSVLASGLGGNLDYSLHSDGLQAKLVLTNKRLDTPATVTSLAVVLPAEAGKESKQIVVPVPHRLPISPAVTVNLGTVASLAAHVAPGKNVSQFKTVTVSENSSCRNCDSVGFALKMSVEYPGGIKQDTLTEAYLHFFAR